MKPVHVRPHMVKLTLTPDPASGDLHVGGGIVKRPR
jgi:hypothetical protein